MKTNQSSSIYKKYNLSENQKNRGEYSKKNSEQEQKKYISHRDSLVEYYRSNPDIVQPVVTDTPTHTGDRDALLPKVPPSVRQYYDIISHDDFINALKEAMTQAFRKIKSEDYTYVFANCSEKRKSEHWVVGELLKEDPRFQPLPPPKQDNNGTLIENPNSKNIFIFDDASYSGKQISNSLSRFLMEPKFKDCTLHIVIPFMSIEALGKLQDVKSNIDAFNIKLKAYHSVRMLSFKEKYEKGMVKLDKTLDEMEQQKNILDNDDWKIFITLTKTKSYLGTPLYLNTPPIRYVTIFAHKSADGTSLGTTATHPRGSKAAYHDSSTREDFSTYWEKKKRELTSE